MGEITARLADRVEELEATARTSSPARSSCSARPQQVGADPVREARADARPQGEDRLLDRHARAALDPRRARDRPRDRGVARATRSSLNTYLGPLPTLIGEHDGRLHTTFNQTVAATGRLSTSNPNLQAIPIRTELGREIRSAFVAEPGTGCSRPTTRRSSCASSRTSRASRSCARRSSAARTSTRRPRPRCSARSRRR